MRRGCHFAAAAIADPNAQQRHIETLLQPAARLTWEEFKEKHRGQLEDRLGSGLERESLRHREMLDGERHRKLSRGVNRNEEKKQKKKCRDRKRRRSSETESGGDPVRLSDFQRGRLMSDSDSSVRSRSCSPPPAWLLPMSAQEAVEAQAKRRACGALGSAPEQGSSTLAGATVHGPQSCLLAIRILTKTPVQAVGAPSACREALSGLGGGCRRSRWDSSDCAGAQAAHQSIHAIRAANEAAQRAGSAISAAIRVDQRLQHSAASTALRDAVPSEAVENVPSSDTGWEGMLEVAEAIARVEAVRSAEFRGAERVKEESNEDRASTDGKDGSRDGLAGKESREYRKKQVKDKKRKREKGGKRHTKKSKKKKRRHSTASSSRHSDSEAGARQTQSRWDQRQRSQTRDKPGPTASGSTVWPPEGWTSLTWSANACGAPVQAQHF